MAELTLESLSQRLEDISTDLSARVREIERLLVAHELNERPIQSVHETPEQLRDRLNAEAKPHTIRAQVRDLKREVEEDVKPVLEELRAPRTPR